MAPFTILSFCGGGIRGLLSSTILQQLNFPLSNISANNQNVNMPYADLLAGCSTGSTIVSWLVNGNTAEDISNLYQTHAVDFYSRQATDPQAPSYSADLGILGQRVLMAGTGVPPGTWPDSVKDLKKNLKVSDLTSPYGKVLLTSFSIGGQTQGHMVNEELKTTTPPWGGSIFTNLPLPPTYHHVPGTNTSVTGDIGWPEAVVGSGGMPGEIGTVSWTGTTLRNSTPTTFAQADGAFFNHDPTFAAIAAALASKAVDSLDDIYVICFGTGLCPNSIASDTAKWGAGQWQKGDGNPNSYTPPVFMNGTISPALNLLLNGPCTTQYQDLAAMMLGDRYVYLNAPFDTFIAENDVNPKTLAYMIQQGTASDNASLANAIGAANTMINSLDIWGPSPTPA